MSIYMFKKNNTFIIKFIGNLYGKYIIYILYSYLKKKNDKI